MRKSIKIQRLTQDCFAGNDKVQCFSCGVRLGDFSKNDLAWEWHLKSSPECSHILTDGEKHFQREYLDIRTTKSQVSIAFLRNGH